MVLQHAVRESCYKARQIRELMSQCLGLPGIATSCHQTSPLRKAFPFPLTNELTRFPSSEATYRLSNVRNTKNTEWLSKRRASLLFQEGMHIFNNLPRFRKNSLFSSTLFFPPSSRPVCPLRRLSAALAAAAFCSLIALRTRWMRASTSAA